MSQSGERVGRRHPRSVSERCALRPHAAWGRSPAHQELAVWHPHTLCFVILILINPDLYNMSAHVCQLIWLPSSQLSNNKCWIPISTSPCHAVSSCLSLATRTWTWPTLPSLSSQLYLILHHSPSPAPLPFCFVIPCVFNFFLINCLPFPQAPVARTG